MWNISLEIIVRLVDASIRVLGLASVAFLALAIFRARHAAARHAVWSAVLVAMLALPVLALLLPSIAVKMWQPIAPVSALVRGSQPSSAPLASRVPPPRRPAAPMIPAWPTALAAIYLAVVAASLARVLWAWRACRGLVGQSDLIRDAETEGLLAELASAQSMTWPLPQLRASRDVIVPMTVGYHEPVIL